MNKLKKLKQLQAVGFMTGSVRFGCDNPQDEDWVILRSDWSKLVGNEIEGFYYTSHDYDEADFRSFFMDYNGIKYNFIIPNDDKVFHQYKIATRIMLRIPVRHIQEKAKRVYLFEALKYILSDELTNKSAKNPYGGTKNDIPPYTGTGDDVPF